MSRRPVENRERPERGGDGRRLRWSESPIPRAAYRRVRRFGAPTLIGYGSGSVGGGTAWMSGLSRVPLEAGDVLVAFAAGYASTIYAPSGWTSLGSGTVGSNLAWRLAWRVSDYAGTSNYGTFTGDALAGQWQAWGIVAGYAFRGGGGPALYASNTASAATEIAFTETLGKLGMQFVGYTCDTGVYPNMACDPSTYDAIVNQSPTSSVDLTSKGLGGCAVAATIGQNIPDTVDHYAVTGSRRAGSWISLAATV